MLLKEWGICIKVKKLRYFGLKILYNRTDVDIPRLVISFDLKQCFKKLSESYKFLGCSSCTYDRSIRKERIANKTCNNVHEAGLSDDRSPYTWLDLTLSSFLWCGSGFGTYWNAWKGGIWGQFPINSGILLPTGVQNSFVLYTGYWNCGISLASSALHCTPVYIQN